MSSRLFGFIATGLFACSITLGCGGGDSHEPADSAATDKGSPATTVTSTTKNDPKGTSPADKPDQPGIEDRVAAVQTDIGAKNWDAAEEKLAALRESLGGAATEAQLAALAPLEKLLASHREEIRRDERKKLLDSAKAAFDSGEWDQALKQIDAVAALAPTESERETLNGLRTSIDQAMTAQLRLSSWIKMLGSSSASEVKTAQSQLLEEPAAALPLVRQVIRKNDPVTTKNSLEFLRKLRKPDLALPIMVSVLEDPAQSASWEIASKEILRLEYPGAGPKLLQLALTTNQPEQRLSALSALASVVDPPEETAVSLLPFLFQDGPQLTAAISACTHAVLVHHHHDLQEWRGAGETITDAQSQQLGQLPERMKVLLALAADQQPTIDAARHLAMALRFINAEPIPGVQILEATPTDPTVKPAALLDGVWNTVDLMSMWYTPVSQSGFVVIDLGANKTVTGVRIWNFNEINAGHRGWKDVEVYVSDTPTALRPVSRGVLLPAPGIADPLDYSQVIPVNFAQGRYVKLVCKEYLAQASHAGLSEIQILGY
ncbi:MAG: discoidin domain-containing protein [Planctomycetaceae bacterium]